jgi:regulator of replication initiation timing
MSAKNYQERIAAPLVRKLKDAIRSILHQFFDKTRELKTALDNANRQIEGLSNRWKKYEPEITRLQDVEKDYKRLRRGLGDYGADEIIKAIEEKEMAEKRTKVKHKSYER